MNTVFNAFYITLFISFARKIFNKLKAPMEHDIPVEFVDGSDNWYIFANGLPLMWEESKESAMVFCWNSIAKRKSLAPKLKIVETAEEVALIAAEDIPGLSPEEIVALNDTIDESE